MATMESETVVEELIYRTLVFGCYAEPSTPPDGTHRRGISWVAWTLFLTLADGTDPSAIISSVTYHLHSDFVPSVRQISSYPFETSAVGYASFMASVTINWKANIHPTTMPIPVLWNATLPSIHCSATVALFRGGEGDEVAPLSANSMALSVVPPDMLSNAIISATNDLNEVSRMTDLITDLQTEKQQNEQENK